MNFDLSKISKENLIKQIQVLKAENEQLRKARQVQESSEKALIESKGRINSILKAIPDMVFRFNNDDILIDFYAPNVDMLEIPGEKLLGKSIEEVFTEELLQRTLTFKERAIERGTVQVFEKKIMAANREHFEEVRIVPGEHNEYFAIFRDITKRKKAEQQVEQYIYDLKESKIQIEQRADELKVLNYRLMESQEELRKLNSSKDKFFSIIAHDLRNPLFSLLGLLEILVERYESEEETENKQIVTNMNKSAKSLYYLLENLLQWSRVQTDKIEYMPVRLKLATLFEVVTSIYRITAANKKISLNYNCPPDLIIYSDENLINTVLRNLISNALKFTPEGGTVNVSAKEIVNYVEITVADTGVGISEENVQKLFNIDQQNSTKGTNNEEGTGLGLVLCKEFVNLNKGEIKVESEAGKGTRFMFTVPVVKPQKTEDN